MVALSSSLVKKRSLESVSGPAMLRMALRVHPRGPLAVQPGVLDAYLRDRESTLANGGQRSRRALQEDVERVVIHPARPEAAKLCLGSCGESGPHRFCPFD